MRRALLPLCLLLALFSCNPNEKSTEKGIIILKDDLGRTLTLKRKPERVLPLATSMTEMLYAVCDTASIVGRTPNCDYPATVLSKPVVNNYPVDYEAILRLKPDLVFTTEGITPLEVAVRLEELGIPVYYQKYGSVEDVFRGLEDIGKIMNRSQQAKYLTDSLRQQVTKIKERHAGTTKLQTVLAITWKDPIYVYGQNTIFTDKLKILGSQNVVKQVYDQPYPALTRESILQLDPDIFIGGTPEELEKEFFTMYPELRKIKAYRTKRMYDPTGNLMERPGPRVVESLLELEKFLYP
ncbi:iron ABC transporter substrate-binding protein [Pontibacter arcticus]|uniref:Iron ABC transporter substrate-binding protein n=1 Tax=Pontibacter arcticus TaxID=2080288 RepID=A0A364RJJ7_9BACT|nr:iron ABC transporter substrate-binding protein [Pontibacter arcticus]